MAAAASDSNAKGSDASSHSGVLVVAEMVKSNMFSTGWHQERHMPHKTLQ